MTRPQENWLAMFESVIDILYDFRDLWMNNTIFTKKTTAFEQCVADIHSQEQVQQAHQTGTGAMKQQEEDEMIRATVRVSSATYVYATDKNDAELKAVVDVSPWLLRKLADGALLNRCRLIHDKAKTKASELVDYGINPENFTTLDKEIKDYADIIRAPRGRVNTRATANKRLKELFLECRELLSEGLDKLMHPFEEDHPQFYRTYKSARVIVDLGGGRNGSASEELEQIEDGTGEEP